MRRVAVVMTAHRTARYIGEAVASVHASMGRLNRGAWHAELRIGVDACDETAAALDALGQPYWWSPANVGSFVLRNSLVALEPADAYVSFDSDDAMLPEYLPRLLDLLGAGVALAGTARTEVDEALQPASPPVVTRWRARGGSGVFTHTAWQTLGGYWDGHRVAMDTEVMDRARKAGLRWAADETPAFLRRRNPSSLMRAPETTLQSPARQAAVAALKVRAADTSLVHVTPTTTPLEYRAPVFRVAVLVTAYRAQPAWLRECLASIASSGALLPRGVVVDLRVGVDGCADTAATLDQDGTPYYWSAENVGTYRLRNSLVALAPAEAYVVFDCDDVMLKPFLPSVVAALRTHAIVGPSRYDVDGRLKGHQLMKYVSGVCGLTHEAWTRLGGYRDERYSADTDLIARAHAASPPVQVHIIRDALYLRRKHQQSLTNAPATGYHSKARRAAQKRMELARERGAWQNLPVTVPLVQRLPQVEQAS